MYKVLATREFGILGAAGFFSSDKPGCRILTPSITIEKLNMCLERYPNLHYAATMNDTKK